MEIGTEISQKIRSAIKAKLIELGAYVDDELPDYIMVMVANKKTQQQMTDDLNLFLGVNTEKFTTWLHSLLKKLQSINSSDPPPSVKEKVEKHKQKHEKSGKHDKPDKQDKSDKTKSVKRKRSHSEKTKSSETGKHKKTSGETTGADSAGVTKHKRHSTESADTTEGSSQKRKHSTDAGETTDVTKLKKSKSVESAAKGDKTEGKKGGVVPEKHEKKDGDEEKAEINITENTDEFSEEMKVEEKKEAKPASKPVTGAKAAKTEKEVEKQKATTGKVKGEKSKESSKHKPTSIVGTVKRKFVDEDDVSDEEYDPLNPAVGAVASTIRAPARKSSVPKSLQANRSLLMKAVSDAEKSVKDLKKDDGTSTSSKPVQKVSPDLRGRLKTAAGLQLMSKSRRKETLESMKYTVDNTEKSKTSKTGEREREKLKDLKLTVKNEDVPTKKKKISPKSKAPASAPVRVAQEALRSISKNKPALTKTIQQGDNSDAEEGNTSESEELTENGDSAENSEDNSDLDSEDEDNGDGVDFDNESVEEIEIEVTDTSAQTDEVKFKEDVAVKNRSAQTDGKDTIEVDAVRIKLATEKVKEIDSNLADMVINSLIPLNIVQQDSFKAFCKSLEIKYHLPKVKKLAGEINRRFEDTKGQLKSKLKEADSVALTHNCWLTADGRHYCTVMANFVTNDWTQMSATLGTFEITKGQVDSIAYNLKTVTEDWKLPTMILVTGLSRHELFSLESYGIEINACMGYFLRRLIRDCLDNKLVSILIEKGRKFLEALQNLCVSHELRKGQKADLKAMLEFHKLYLDEPDLWNTTVDMLSSLSDQAETIRDVVKELNITSGDINDKLYSDEDVNVVKNLVVILSQFKTAAEILTASDTITAEKRLPTLIKLQKSLVEDSDDPLSITSLKGEIRKQISLLMMHNKESLLLSCIVHPQTKQLMFVSPEEKSHAKLLLFDKMTELMRRNIGSSVKEELKKVDEEMSDGGSKPAGYDQQDGHKRANTKRKTLAEKFQNKSTEIDTRKETGEVSEILVESSETGSEVRNEMTVDDSEADIQKSQTDNDNTEFTVKHEESTKSVTDSAHNDIIEGRKIDEHGGIVGAMQQPTDSEIKMEGKECRAESVDKQSFQDNAECTADDNISDFQKNSESVEDVEGSIENKGVTSEDMKVDSEMKPENGMPDKAEKRIDSKIKESSKTVQKSKIDTTDWLEDVIGSGESHEISPEQKAKVELDLYLAEPAVKTSALNWWKDKQSTFPTVSQIAKSFLAVPASGITTEEVMSLADDIVDAKKSMIDPKHLDAMLFLNKNKGIFGDKDKH